MTMKTAEFEKFVSLFPLFLFFLFELLYCQLLAIYALIKHALLYVDCAGTLDCVWLGALTKKSLNELLELIRHYPPVLSSLRR